VSAPHERGLIGTSELVPFPISKLTARVELAAFPVAFRFFRISSGFAGDVRRIRVYGPASRLSLPRTAGPLW
jgi:hypothetical protein